MTIGTVPLRLPGERPRIAPALAHQLLYSAGRLVTYGFLGALAGILSQRLSALDLPLVGGQQVLAIVAGVLMLLIGLSTLGVLRIRWLDRVFGGAPAGGGACGGMLRQFLSARGVGPFLLAGVFTGFLPCGLVYAALAKAAEAANPLGGWTGMIVFGLGTTPAMVAIGCSSTLVSVRLRTRVLQLAACFVILLGGVTVYRGLPLHDSCCASQSADTVLAPPTHDDT